MTSVLTSIPYDLLHDIVAYEGGELDETQTRELFQGLVNTGLAWQLQGHYGRTAAAYLQAGLISPPSAGHA